MDTFWRHLDHKWPLTRFARRLTYPFCSNTLRAFLMGCVQNPSAFLELMTAVRASGEELVGFHDYYVRGSGISPDSPIAYKHRDLMSILAHLLSWDQANGGQLASAELTARLVLQIHTAVKKNPKAPDFKGTNLMITSTMDAAGGVTTGPFARYVAEEQRTHAYTLKQQRLFAEEEKRAAGKKGAKKE